MNKIAFLLVLDVLIVIKRAEAWVYRPPQNPSAQDYFFPQTHPVLRRRLHDSGELPFKFSKQSIEDTFTFSKDEDKQSRFRRDLLGGLSTSRFRNLELQGGEAQHLRPA